MRAASPAMIAYLAAVRAGTQPLLMADCFTFALLNGTVLTYGDKDVPLTVGSTVFAANSLRVSGARFKCSVGLGVDTQELDVLATPADFVNGVPFMAALRNGAFDGCEIQRDRALFAPVTLGGILSLAASYAAPAIGSITLFKGRLATVDELGRTTAKITVNSDLTLLDLDMPHNFYQPQCNHALYDAGCTLSKAAYGTPGIVATGSTANLIRWAGAVPGLALGTLTMTSGLNNGVSASIKSVAAGASLTLLAPFETPPSPGDTFIAYQGCDHSLGPQGCAKFANQEHFRGFPFVPQPALAYGS